MADNEQDNSGGSPEQPVAGDKSEEITDAVTELINEELEKETLPGDIANEEAARQSPSDDLASFVEEIVSPSEFHDEDDGEGMRGPGPGH